MPAFSNKSKVINAEVYENNRLANYLIPISNGVPLPAGPIGPTGPTGIKGDQGMGFQIFTHTNDYSELPIATTSEIGKFALVKGGDLYVYVGENKGSTGINHSYDYVGDLTNESMIIGPTGFTGPTGTVFWNNSLNHIYYNSGNVGIGTDHPYYSLDISGSSNVKGFSYATYFITTSDYRIKENPVLLDDSFIVDNLRPVKYINKVIGKEDYGFIAHEVQEIYPNLVVGVKDGEINQSLNYNGFIAILVREIKELKNELNKMKKNIEELKNK